jgi:predicted AAA+ superfamily ATPase
MEPPAPRSVVLARPFGAQKFQVLNVDTTRTRLLISQHVCKQREVIMANAANVLQPRPRPEKLSTGKSGQGAQAVAKALQDVLSSTCRPLIKTQIHH